jgi:hypothetical protein
MTTATPSIATPTLPFCRVPLLPLEQASIRWALIGTYIFQFCVSGLPFWLHCRRVQHKCWKQRGWTNKATWFTSKSRQLNPIVASEVCCLHAVVGDSWGTVLQVGRSRV